MQVIQPMFNRLQEVQHRVAQFKTDMIVVSETAMCKRTNSRLFESTRKGFQSPMFLTMVNSDYCQAQPQLQLQLG